MSNNQILCFKLCYILGASEEYLESTYSKMYSLADSLMYFGEKQAAQHYRVLIQTYYRLIRFYDNYRRVKHVAEFERAFIEIITLSGLTDEIEQLLLYSSGLDEVINKLSRKANSLLNQVYDEMEFGLCFSDFCLLTLIPALSHLEILQVQFFLKRMPLGLNVHFFSNDVFNIDTSDMLRSDTLLVRRLNLVTGSKQGKIVDKSALGKALLAEDDTAFLHLPDLLQYQEVLVDGYSVIEADQQQIRYFCTDGLRYVLCKDCDACVSQLSEDSTPASTIIITHRTEEKLETLEPIMERATFLVTMPVPRATYRRILRKSWPNVFLLSMREAVEESLLM